MGHQLNPEWQDMSNSIDILILMYIKNKYADNMFLYGMVTKYDSLSYSCEFILIHKNKFSLILYESFYVLKIYNKMSPIIIIPIFLLAYNILCRGCIHKETNCQCLLEKQSLHRYYRVLYNV